MKLGNQRIGNSRFSATTTDSGGSDGGEEEEEDDWVIGPAEEALIDTIEPQGPDTPKERLKAHMKPPYPTSGGTQWEKLLTAISNEFEDFIETRNKVTLASFIDTAERETLGKIGSVVNTPRRTGETDSHYRARLKVAFHRNIASGTIQDIKTTSALLLDTDETKISISEDFDQEPARFDITVPSAILENAAVSVDEFRSLLTDVKAGGVRVVAKQKGSFTYRSESDFHDGINDSGKGYNGLDDTGEPMDMGGGYSGLI